MSSLKQFNTVFLCNVVSLGSASHCEMDAEMSRVFSYGYETRYLTTFFSKERGRDWNHFIRPNLWAFGLAIFLIGALASGVYLFNYFIGAIIAILLCTSSITINHHFDAGTDKKSKQLYRFPIASGRISKPLAAGFSLLVVLASILLSFFLNSNSFLLVLFANFMIFTYSAPPLRIKERPFLETIWNGMK